MTDVENRSKHFSNSVLIIKTAVNNAIDDLGELIEIFYPKYSRYPRQFVSFRQLRDDVCSKLSISPLVWDEALAGKPMVPLLALESPEYGGEGMTIKQGLNLMTRITDLGFLEIASKMNEKEALLFWSRATGERPAMPIHRFLQLVSYITDSNVQSLQSIRKMMETMQPSEIIQKIVGEEKVDLEVRTMQPGQPFTGPVYRAWSKVITPTEVYAEVIENPRRYLHITEFPKGTYKGILYNRDKQIISKVANVPYRGESIFEVEAEGNKVKCITDVMALGNDWDIYKLDYRDRISYLERLSFDAPVKTGKLLQASTDFRQMLETLEDQNRLRLTLTGPFSIGGEGGWMILKDAFHVHLLVHAIRKDEDFNTHVRLSAMDGYEIYEVGEVELPVNVAQHIRQSLAQQGVLAGQNWLPIDEYGLVVMVEIDNFSLSDLSVKKAQVEYIDDNMGYSDVSQLTDLIEMGN
tara:strand:+ start:87 stop:1481 length:1395 start_codon:yes stop_codon:yes gene_type:complete